MLDLETTPHRRFNPLTGDWVLVSPQRLQRPWRGRVEAPPRPALQRYDPDCYLCPGNQRAGGDRNPAYDSTFVFANDFASLLPRPEARSPDGGRPATAGDGDPAGALFRAEPIHGLCRVVCYSPRHDLTLPEMDRPAIRQVIDVWAEQTELLSREYAWVQIFENKGEIMGCSNAHPHGQIWGVARPPVEAVREDRQQRDYWLHHGEPLLCAYDRQERARQERIVVANASWLAVVPFWAAWPFETLLLPRRRVSHLPALNESERQALADILQRLLCKYDNLFDVSFPYSMGWHGAPAPLAAQPHWQLHAHFYPPLLRSATVKKFMVGYEMLGEIQRDLTPELAAARLRPLAEVLPAPGADA